MSKNFYEAVENRRSIYAISNEQVISEERIEEIVEEAIKHAPTSFNSQSGRVVVLFGEQNQALWNITKETLRKMVPVEKFGETEQKMNAFSAGSGTILFFEDQQVVKALQEQFSSYADKFPDYSLQSSGILQYIVWTALSLEGLGASLQHYQPLIDDEVKAKWNLPANWDLVAQMPFGKPLAPAGDKEFESIDARLKVFK